MIDRGRNRQTIFHNKNYFEAFLQTLKEVSEQFDAIKHAGSVSYPVTRIKREGSRE